MDSVFVLLARLAFQVMRADKAVREEAEADLVASVEAIHLEATRLLDLVRSW
jgi:hypothetical protein